MTASQWLGDRIPTLLRPSILLCISAYHFVMTILEILFISRTPRTLLSLTTLRYKSFARLWRLNGAAMSLEMPGPLFTLLSTCRGTILDIGPGSGEMLRRFTAGQITALYGAEPAADLHPGLKARAQEAGFGERFHALLCGAEPESLIPALHRSGILEDSGRGTASEGVFDEICCVRVLCGVPHARQTIKGLYQLLKPGGRMVICEHVANPWRTEGRLAARLAQVVYTVLGWPFFMGGCELQRHTWEYLEEAGEWDQFDLKYYGPKDAIPFIVGELRKKGGEGDAGKSYAQAVKV